MLTLASILVYTHNFRFGNFACAPELSRLWQSTKIMVDIHSHILYGVDDGAGTLQESVALLRAAAEHDTTDIVATPHANSVFPFRPGGH